jgi:hypothetical protein
MATFMHSEEKIQDFIDCRQLNLQEGRNLAFDENIMARISR